MADVAAQRAALAETRARIDSRLEELTQHVPERANLKATAMRYGGAVLSAVVGVGIVVVTTKSILHGRRTDKDARRYAEAVLSAMPEVAEAYGVHVAKAAVERSEAEVVGTPRGGVGSAVLMAVGVVGGVAVAQAMGGSRGDQG